MSDSIKLLFFQEVMKEAEKIRAESSPRTWRSTIMKKALERVVPNFIDVEVAFDERIVHGYMRDEGGSLITDSEGNPMERVVL